MKHVLIKWISKKNQNNLSFSNVKKQDFFIYGWKHTMGGPLLFKKGDV
jgi:hypothetical protein